MVCTNVTAVRTNAVPIIKSSWLVKAIIAASSIPPATVCQLEVRSRQMISPTVITPIRAMPKSAAWPIAMLDGVASRAHARGSSSRYLGAGDRAHSSRPKKKMTVAQGESPNTGSVCSGCPLSNPMMG